MRTSQIYGYVIAAALGVSLSAYVYAGCGSCGGDAGHTHKEAVKTQANAKAACSSCTAAEKPCAKCSAAKKACATEACKSACSSKAKAKATAHSVKTITTE